jgi:hypothetical protein
MEYYTYYLWYNTHIIYLEVYNIEINMNTMCKYHNMCNMLVSINMSSVKEVMLVWDVMELMLFLPIRQGLYLKGRPTTKYFISIMKNISILFEKN